LIAWNCGTGKLFPRTVQYIVTGAEKKCQLYIQDWKYVLGSRECEKDVQVMGVNLMKMSSKDNTVAKRLMRPLHEFKRGYEKL